MNRQEHRKLQRQMKAQNIVVNPGSEQADHTNAKYCWRHKLKLDSIDNPTERDKKLIESITLKPFKTTDKNGYVTIGRSCQKCYNTVIIKTSLLDPKKESIIDIPTEKDASIYLPDM